MSYATLTDAYGAFLLLMHIAFVQTFFLFFYTNDVIYQSSFATLCISDFNLCLLEIIFFTESRLCVVLKSVRLLMSN